MEANICDINHLDADVLLPPRKRLLAGYKKQSSDANGDQNGGSHQPMVASSSSPSSSSSSEFARLNNLLNNSNLSNKEIAELAKSAAIAANKTAQDARAAAEEKAAIATKAIAEVKNALALVDSFNQEVASKEKTLKKNKLKKHVPVQLLYKNHQTVEDSNTDEELARRLHRAMNSSPRISKNFSSSDVKGHKHKKPKSLSASEKIRVPNGGIILGGNSACTSSGHTVITNVDSENVDSIQELYTLKVDEKESKYEKTRQLELENEEAEPNILKEKTSEETSTPGKRRGRLKLRKLPLSICTSRDRVNPKEEMIKKATPLTDKNMGNPSAGSRMPLFAMEPSDAVVPIEATPTWKCQEFKAPACVKQNKVVQS
ncbi:hypothetical protein ACOSP7_022501 [Xanthoceras sorbifolium]|uniref:Uncharacterized protein n=1 Tax=Xanthoceras sorbifolium TaxID=99658 RepID=A0ABQ8HP81_9ROSI|nr:hypothetical protein JRO89_XS08G0108800 [Xanthoceras sorbifolium]